MKLKKTISTMFIFGTMVLGGLKMAHASIEDTNRVNAIARAKANLKLQTLEGRVSNSCQEVLAQIPGENGGTDCEEKRSQCETQIRESFRGDIEGRIAACDPQVRTDECFITQGFNIDHCTDAGFSTDECVEQCSDDSTPSSRCLEDIDFARRLAIAVAKYKARLRVVCRAEAPAEQPTDPVVEGGGAELPVANPVVNANGGQNAAGGCSVNGVSGGMGSLLPYLVGLLPLTAAFIRKRK